MGPMHGHSKVIGILGNPIGHSLSPRMHNAAIQALKLPYVYVPCEVPKDRIGEAVFGLRALNFCGANVTLPFKQSVLPFLDEVSPLSQILQAVNTIVNKNGRLWGTSTDGQGFIQSFHEQGFSFAGESLAIFGTGGSARSILLTVLLEEKPAQIFLVGRNAAALKKLAQECREKTGRDVEPVLPEDYDSIKSRCRILVNCTPLGMAPYEEESILEADQLMPGQIVYDIVYNPRETRLLRLARAGKLKTVGGLGMLIHQGIASFTHWTGMQPDPEIYFKALEHAF